MKQIIASPGNPGIAQIATCLPGSNYAALAEEHGVDLTIVGPEAPLVAGVVDDFQSRGLKIIGPSQAAARLEGSKIFAKAFFKQAGIPTARSGNSINEFSFPVVIKADGLAAGKGVVIAHQRSEAEEAIRRLGPNVLVEEFLEGEEVSFIGLSDGNRLIPFPPAQDHKRVFDGDQGPNTGGMGAYCDVRILTSAERDVIMDRIMLPTLAQMRKEGSPFTGFLYAGLMMTEDGPKVLEFNVRLGDPETQALMHSFQGDFVEFLNMIPQPSGPPSVCVVLASRGYPESARTGDIIRGVEEAESTGATVFHAGTKREGENLVTNGGRVLGVTASGETLRIATDRAYQAVDKIHFDGMHYRKDIGQKGLRRW